jgi:hypothetical protein
LKHFKMAGMGKMFNMLQTLINKTPESTITMQKVMLSKLWFRFSNTVHVDDEIDYKLGFLGTW